MLDKKIDNTMISLTSNAFMMDTNASVIDSSLVGQDTRVSVTDMNVEVHQHAPSCQND